MFVKKLSGAITILGLMLFMVLAFSANSVKAQTSHPLNSIWVDPSQVDFNPGNVSLGTQFNVTIWAYIDSGTFTWQVGMTFNTSYVKAVTAGFTGTTGSLFWAGHTTVPVTPIVDNSTATGSVLIGESLLGTDVGTQKNASLAWVEFQVVSLPNATVTSLTDVLGINSTNTYFLDGNLSTVTTQIFDGAYVNVIPEFSSAVLMIVMLVAMSSAVLLMRKRIVRH